MDQSDITLERMRTFVRVAERGNLSAVARDLGTGQSTVTRHLRELEAAVGAPLLNRTTRRVAMTEEGSRYYAQCVQILRLVEQASEEIRNTRESPSGTIRLSCTAALGVLHVTRLIFAFQAHYPDIHIDFNLTDERIDLVKEGVDIALRLGPLADSSLKLHHLGDSTRLLVASPAYLAAQGRPQKPEELAAHNVIRMVNVAGSDTLVMTGPDGKTHSIAVKGDLRVDHGLAAREAFRAGRGIGSAHRWLVDDLLASDELEPLLPGYELASTPFNMLIVPERAKVARVRLLIDYLVEQATHLPGMTR
ncbi:LysR family transcriptional regulator [Prosthecomicrobium hirschii]|uniref:LysR family transcriptional regulator n=1 Tax=Prosthecodimorpha hirschii TaxID=665126 RepID=UPI0022210814|nr:LysR family transcriptional regulator [Prosthecomicrobium hirschii]MCW1841330.1 LysR family transcriptional regulator [Prosthecomicrobium hirschii]